jgi:hypothetical protein
MQLKIKNNKKNINTYIFRSHLYYNKKVTKKLILFYIFFGYIVSYIPAPIYILFYN